MAETETVTPRVVSFEGDDSVTSLDVGISSFGTAVAAINSSVDEKGDGTTPNPINPPPHETKPFSDGDIGWCGAALRNIIPTGFIVMSGFIIGRISVRREEECENKVSADGWSGKLLPLRLTL